MFNFKIFLQENSINIGRLFFLTGFIIVFFIIPGFSQNWGGGNRASSVVIEKPVKEKLSLTKDIQGKVVSSLTSVISSVTSGSIVMERIKIGDRVKKNQLIATQDSNNIKYNLKINIKLKIRYFLI